MAQLTATATLTAPTAAATLQMAMQKAAPAKANTTSLSRTHCENWAPGWLTGYPAANAKTAAVTNYESIGLNLRRISLVENTPTMIGTLNLPGTNGTIFLIMTVRSAD